MRAVTAGYCCNNSLFWELQTLSSAVIYNESTSLPSGQWNCSLQSPSWDSEGSGTLPIVYQAQFIQQRQPCVPWSTWSCHLRWLLPPWRLNKEWVWKAEGQERIGILSALTFQKKGGGPGAGEGGREGLKRFTLRTVYSCLPVHPTSTLSRRLSIWALSRQI